MLRSDAAQSQDAEILPVDYPNLHKDVAKGHRILIRDGRVELVVKSVEKELVRCRVLRWPVVQMDDGHWRETGFRFSEFDVPFVEEGREFQFYHSTTGDDRA